MKHLCIAVMALLVAAVPARATTGGPTVARALGWDPREQKVYATITYFDQSAGPDQIVYFDLRRAPRKAVVVPWGLDREGREARLAALCERLQPLDPCLVQAIPRSTTIVKADSIGVSHEIARYRIRISAPRFYRLELTTYRRPTAQVASLWAILGRAEKLAILSYVGSDAQAAYQAQTPVLLSGAGDDLVSVESIPHP
jgi:hypothetical protein